MGKKQRQKEEHTSSRMIYLLIQSVNSAVNLAALLLFLALAAYAGYAVWDSMHLTEEASAEVYEDYKPVDGEEEPLENLQQENPDTIGWLEVYGTGIDYPLMQGEDNTKYVNTNAKGEYSLSGSLFLDYRNHADFTDTLSIIYGHHMDGALMFGELGEYAEEGFFREHTTAMLYGGGKEQEVEFFAFLKVNAYDDQIYEPFMKQDAEKQDFLERLKQDAMQYREISQEDTDRYVLLSTCSSDETNGRMVLVGEIRDAEETETVEVDSETTEQRAESNAYKRKNPVLIIAGGLILIGVGGGLIVGRKKRRKREG